MPSPSESPFDQKSTHEATELMNELRENHFKEVEARPAEMLSPGPNFESVQRIRNRLIRPLMKISREIPVEDICDDLEDFGVLAAYGQATDGVMTVLRIEENKTVVPVLPQVGLLEQYQMVGWPSFPPDFGWFRRKFFQVSFDESRLGQVPIKKAQDGFFAGLKSFLAARIGGVRWWRSRQSDGGGGTTGGGGGRGYGGSGGGSGGAGGGRSAQMWEINTDGHGLSLAYHGTHAARVANALPGGVTSPVDVYLPMGTLYLGANAGPSGTFIFDYGVVLNVPSTHARPVHTTKAF
jgi:hypothetical protein